MSLAPSMGQPDAFLRIRGLTKRFAGTVAVDGLDLSVRRGEMVAFLGPSGCGKSTSLRMIAGLSPATSGTIEIGGRDVTHVPTHKRDIGLVFQSYALFPHMSVLRNVMFGLEMRKVPAAEAERRARAAIALVRLEGREERRPAQLSGGQQQRVALARALVIEPSILLFDEPLSNLDAKLRDEMRAEIREIQQRLGITSIFVTHDQVEALSMCDRVAVLNGGRLEQVGTPHELYEHPATAFVATFVGRSNRIPAESEGTLARSGPLTFALPAQNRGRIEIVVRPHRIEMVPGQTGGATGDGWNRVAGTVRRSSYAGDMLQYDVQAGELAFTVEHGTAHGETPLPGGTPVTLSWRVSDTLAFRSAS